MITTFKDIKVWQKAHQLALEIYKITRDFPVEEKFALTTQIRRSVISVPSNIVEGFKRKNLKDRLHFYNISNASLEELKYQLLISYDLHYIKEREYENLLSLAEEVSKMLNSWSKSQK